MVSILLQDHHHTDMDEHDDDEMMMVDRIKVILPIFGSKRWRSQQFYQMPLLVSLSEREGLLCTGDHDADHDDDHDADHDADHNSNDDNVVVSLWQGMCWRYWLPSDGEEKKRPRRENSEKEERFFFSSLKKSKTLSAWGMDCNVKLSMSLSDWHNFNLLE